MPSAAARNPGTPTSTTRPQLDHFERAARHLKALGLLSLLPPPSSPPFLFPPSLFSPFLKKCQFSTALMP